MKRLYKNASLRVLLLFMTNREAVSHRMRGSQSEWFIFTEFFLFSVQFAIIRKSFPEIMWDVGSESKH